MVPDKVEKLLQRAQQAIAQRDWDKAKQVYLLALGLKSDLPDIHYGLAAVFFHLGEYTSAAHHFREVTRLEPARASAYINLGAVLNLLQQYDDAITTLRKAIQLDPQKVDAFYNLGLVYRRKGQPDMAITAYKEAIRLNPRMADAQFNLANIYLDKQQYRQAVMHYEQALQIRPGWDRALSGLEQAKEALSGNKARAASEAAPEASTARAGSANSLNRMADPAVHGAFLAMLHQATVESEEGGRLLQKILLEEIDPAIKELASVLLHTQGSRGELDACLGRFEMALQHLRNTHEVLHKHEVRMVELGENFPGS
jgi:tetratricopeptide (TPR) repeat protein